MGLLCLASLSLFCQIAFLCAQGRVIAGRHWGSDDTQVMGNRVLLVKPKQESLIAHSKLPIDPALNVFFTLDDLKVGKQMPIYFPSILADPSKSPRLLTREQSDSIPFSSAQLSRLLSFFSIPEASPQAKAVESTLRQCELEPIEGETRFCAASLESMLDSAREVFGPKAQFRVLTTTYLPSKKKKARDDPLQNYTILQAPEQIDATRESRVMGCHTMPYPYAVYYCHSQAKSENRVYQISLGSGGGGDGGGERSVEAVAVCHMDTSLWDRDHMSFRVLGVEPGSSPVCHFFPPDNLVWVTP